MLEASSARGGFEFIKRIRQGTSWKRGHNPCGVGKIARTGYPVMVVVVNAAATQAASLLRTKRLAIVDIGFAICMMTGEIIK